jgi:hypothetical protein
MTRGAANLCLFQDTAADRPGPAAGGGTGPAR